MGRQVKKSQINSKTLEALFSFDIQKMRWQQYKYEYLCTLVYAANEHPTHENGRGKTHTPMFAQRNQLIVIMRHCFCLIAFDFLAASVFDGLTHHTLWLCEISSERVNIICTLKQSSQSHKVHALVMKTQTHTHTHSALHTHTMEI